MRLFFKLLTTFSVFTLLMFATSCSDNQVEPLFEESVNERTKTLKDKYVNILTTAENGWIGYYSPNENTGFFITLLNFNDNGVVDIASDYESGTLNNSVTYAINKSLKIELVFESASVFSSIFEINNNNNAGEFVFNILSATEDEVILESKLDFGDDVTILRLRKALISELDLEPIYASVNNIAHDETKSVFRNILLNDKPIATFNFNSSTRFATITYIQDGELIEEVTQIIITASGFEFVEPLDINGAILTSFSYDEVSDAYVNTDDGLKIIYDSAPRFLLNPYDFGNENGNIRILRTNARFAPIDESSSSFVNFFQGWVQFFSQEEGGRSISRVYIRDLDTDAPFLHIYYFSGPREFTIRFPLTYVITKTSNGNRIIKFTEVGMATNRRTGSQPMLDFIFRDSGFYVQKMTPLPSQNTLGFISVDDPTILVHWYDF